MKYSLEQEGLNIHDIDNPQKQIVFLNYIHILYQILIYSSMRYLSERNIKVI